MVPCIGEETESPDAAAPAFLPAERLGFFAPPPPADGGEPTGQDDLEPAAADLDGDLVALLGLGGVGATPP